MEVLKNAAKTLVALVLTLTISGCAGEFSPENALLDIQGQDEFLVAYSAPIELGQETLTAEAHKDIKKYLQTQYGELFKAELIKYNIVEQNSWHTVVDIVLSEKGEKLYDNERTQYYRASVHNSKKANDVYYVEVCHLVPEQVLSYAELSEDRASVVVSVVERGITPFGHHLGFNDGRIYEVERTFTRGTFGWNLDPL